jgi:hypothetical protein
MWCLRPRQTNDDLDRQLAPVNGSAQRFDFVTNSFRQVSSALSHIANALCRIPNPIPRLITPFFQSFLGIFIAALQIAAQLFASLWREQEGGQCTRAQADQKESHGGTDVVAFGRFVSSKSHD